MQKNSQTPHCVNTFDGEQAEDFITTDEKYTAK